MEWTGNSTSLTPMVPMVVPMVAQILLPIENNNADIGCSVSEAIESSDDGIEVNNDGIEVVDDFDKCIDGSNKRNVNNRTLGRSNTVGAMEVTLFELIAEVSV